MNCEGCLNRGDCEDCASIPMKDFYVGEIIPLKGQLFRVGSIGSSELRLELVRMN